MTELLIACVALVLSLGVVTALKGKWGVLALGLVVTPAWLLGALRLARPSSLWARGFYGRRKRERAVEQEASRRRLALIAGLVSLGVVGALLAFLKAYRIPTSSMEPTLHCARPAPACRADESDRVLARRFLPGEHPARGDLVTFRSPPVVEAKCGARGTFVHRVVGLPGERFAIADGTLTIDGSTLDEHYLPQGVEMQDLSETLIPADHYFVLGDNRGFACDSSVWGALDEDYLVGKLVARYWPPDRVGLIG